MCPPHLWEVPLTKGQVALVDREDYERIASLSWYAVMDKCTKTFYAIKDVPGSSAYSGRTYMHRMIMGDPAGILIDHRDPSQTLDNRKSNLREASKQQNQCNQRIRSDNTSGFRGLRYHRGRMKPWNVRVNLNGKSTSHGYYEDKIFAAKVYDRVARELHGEFARLNFPEEPDAAS